MPREVKVVDKTMRKDPSTGKMVKSENYRGVVWTEKTKTTKKGGVVRKKVVGENFEAIRSGKPLVERSVKVDKFDKSGNLKKSTTITDSGKTVVRPGKGEVKKKVGFFAKSILNKNI
jgi:hypothetical protein